MIIKSLENNVQDEKGGKQKSRRGGYGPEIMNLFDHLIYVKPEAGWTEEEEEDH